jgi:hypothetical protein
MRLVLHGLMVIVAAAACALAVAGTGAASPIGGEPPARVRPTPEEAVRAAVEAGGEASAGDCAGTVSPRDLGRVCARLVAERAGTRAYLVGRTFSEFDRWVFVAPAGDGWQVVGVAPLDFRGPPDPPWPG